MPEFQTASSGTRTEFATGAVRDQQAGKGRYDLIPFEALDRLAKLYERGAELYGARNWEKGQPASTLVSSMLRHGHKAAAGMVDEDHLAAVIWNAAGAITILDRVAAGQLPADLDDLPRADVTA